MAMYKVELLSSGGHRIPAIIVEASNPDKAKAAAVAIANAQASAKGEPYQYHATNVTSA